MKVLHVITGLTVGGAEMSLLRITQELRRLGIVSIVVSLGSKGGVLSLFEKEGVEVYSLDLRKKLPFLLPFRFFGLVRILRRVRPDVVQGWMYPGNLASSLAVSCVGSAIPVYWNIRQSLYSFKYEKPFMSLLIRLSAWFSRTPTRIIYNARTSAFHHEGVGYDAAKTLVIPNGFDTEIFKPTPPEVRRAARERLGLPVDAFLVGLIGRDHPKKDRAGFLKAAALAASDIASIHYLFLGRGMEKPDHPLRALALAHGLEDRVTFLGEKAEIHEWMTVLDVAVSSSFTEGFPNVVGEAMACGVPCVATDVGDTAHLVGDFGYLVPPRDPTAMSQALVHLGKLSPEGRREIGRKGRERIFALFSLKSSAARYAALYQATRHGKL